MNLHKSDRRAFIRDSFAVAATAALLEPASALFEPGVRRGAQAAANPAGRPLVCQD